VLPSVHFFTVIFPPIRVELSFVKVFISWSGERSKAVAEALREWLPSVIQALEPWLSAADIGGGSKWQPEIVNKLKETNVGILCLTSDNLKAPWLLFEAGALSKLSETTLVCPYLLHLEKSQVEFPLAMWRTKSFRKRLWNLHSKNGGRTFRDALTIFQRYPKKGGLKEENAT
jgi:hypothetical protein